MSTEFKFDALNQIIIGIIHFSKAYNPKITSQTLYGIIWNSVFSSLFLTELQNPNSAINKITFGEYQLNLRDFLLNKIILILRHYKIDYSPIVLTNTSEVVDEVISTEQAIIFASIHNGFSHNLKLFEKINRRITTIGLQPFVDEALSRSGIKNNINVINKDKYALAYLKKAALRRDLISVAVDYKSENVSFEYINPNLFEFALANNIPLYFTKSEAIDSGDVNVALKRASTTQTAQQNAQDFIQFYNSVGFSRKKLTVK